MFAEDLSVFFRDFGAQATLGAATVRGVLGSGFDDAALDGYGMGAGTSPTFVLPSAVVPAKPEGMLLAVTTGPGAGTYRVGNAEHDGTGIRTLKLIRS